MAPINHWPTAIAAEANPAPPLVLPTRAAMDATCAHQWRLRCAIVLTVCVVIACNCVAVASTAPAASGAHHDSQQRHSTQACPATAMPVVQTLPTVQRPFVFFHPRKSGGTSLRFRIRRAWSRVASASSTGATLSPVLLAPCHSHECGLHEQLAGLNASYLRRVAVLAAHVPWGAHQRLPAYGSGSTAPACLTMLRDPVDRVVSCFYFR